MMGYQWQAVLAWRGEAYVGWQTQPNGVSIQSTVEAALGSLCDTDRIPVVASGRTDSGVHALGQQIAFKLPYERTVIQVQEGLNSRRPDDIVCLGASPAPDGYCPRQWSIRKTYRYRILNRFPSCPFRKGLVWQIKQPLDHQKMALGLSVFEGTHDWSSFRARGCAAKSPVRKIERASFHALDDGELQIEFVGKGFLRHQVRIMVGTLVDLGFGRLDIEDLTQIIEAQDRTAAGRTAPAYGLTLVNVEMGDGPLGETKS